jgi:hypothetical protein
MVKTYKEMSSYSGQRNDEYMYTVLENEVNQSFNGYGGMKGLGIASSPYSNSKLYSPKLSFLNVRFQDSFSSNIHS